MKVRVRILEIKDSMFSTYVFRFLYEDMLYEAYLKGKVSGNKTEKVFFWRF